MNQKKDTPNMFMPACIVFVIILAIRFYGEQVNAINSTMLAFSYKYGFVSRGLIGSVYQILDALLPVNLYTYDSVMIFTGIVTGIFFALLLYFFALCISESGVQNQNTVQLLCIFYMMFAVPFFVTKYNFGRLDIYLLMLSLAGVILILKERAEWLIIPFVALATMVHQGYVFMFFNILLVLLFVKCCDCQGKKQRKYLCILITAFVVASVLFLWFELFSHANGTYAYEEVVELAKAVSRDGKTIHTDVIDKEILGIDLTKREIPFHLQNAVQFPIFALLVSPYIVLLVGFLKGMIQKAKGRLSKLKYISISIGVLTILPDLLLKVDFGRWMFAIVSYYLIVFLTLYGMRDEIFVNQMECLKNRFRNHKGIAVLLFIYPFILQPFCDVSICHVTAVIAGKINEGFLHWW